MNNIFLEKGILSTIKQVKEIKNKYKTYWVWEHWDQKVNYSCLNGCYMHLVLQLYPAWFVGQRLWME